MSITEPKHDPLREGTLQEALDQTMNEEEFGRVKEILGRTPNVTELAIFAVMWSEHCSYKNSILELKKLPRSGSKMLVEAGEENAGLIDIGDGWAVAFKIESHNHPSAVEPFQGAATGVGGILRDVFTMGARPLASLDSLHFASLKDPHNRFLMDGVVRGIGHYGNCFGVPTIAGEVLFDESYAGNPLINAMAVGVVKTENVMHATAKGKGNPVFYVGSRTGRDGMHGATFASEELSEDNEAKRPAVQVGDPFAEKLLLEATLELSETDAVVGIQDMGAAGIICSTSEMSAAGEVGMDIDLDLVPMREEGMDPWEILLSESQERMLLVAEAGKEDIVKGIFDKWDLQAVVIGHVNDDGMLRFSRDGRQVAEVPAWNLVLGGGAPQYVRESKRPDDLDELVSFDPLTLPEPENPGEVLLKLLADPDITCKQWVYEQYDQSVRTNTAVEPGFGDAGVIRVEGTGKGLSIKTDGNGRKVRLDPRRGAAATVAESARNVACTGARPAAITNCLNFGHPYKPEVYYFFREAVVGMGEACREFDTPVTGGNVSFYNETRGMAVFPTPTIGMLGILEDVHHAVSGSFKQENDIIYLLGKPTGTGLGGSCYLKTIHNLVAGPIDPVDYEAEKKLHNLLARSTEDKLLQSAHDISDGGLAVTLAECCIMDKRNPIGARIEYNPDEPSSAVMFGESPGLVLVSVKPENAGKFEKVADEAGVRFRKVGVTGGETISWEGKFKVNIEDAAREYYETIPGIMEGR